MSKENKDVIVDKWTNCYRQAWKGIIVPAATAHPAKFSRALVRKIYDHVEEEGWATKGSTIIDPFGGVALGALEAMQRGMHWRGVELEPRFMMMGDRFECLGFTKEQWKRFYHRPNKLNVCPDCHDAMKVGPVESQQHFFATSVRSIPHREPHHFVGNIEAWENLNLPGTATLVQGDSRKLIEVLYGKADCSVTSPPYVSGGHHNDVMGAWNSNGGGHGVTKDRAGYGGEQGQLGQLPEGQIEMSVSSPPYEKSVKMGSGHLDSERLRQKGLDTSANGHVGDDIYSEQYGRTEGQVGNLSAPDGSLEVALTSPPFGDSGHSDWHLDAPGRLDKMFESYQRSGGGLSREDFAEHCRQRQDGYGHSEGQLADLAMSSPPYAGSLANAKNFSSEEAASREASREIMKSKSSTYTDLRYGTQEGQIGSMPEGQLVVSSPPYSGNSGKHDRTGHERALRRHERLGFTQGVGCFKTSEAYGETEGQLGSMDSGDIDAVITSPPYIDSVNAQDHGIDWSKAKADGRARGEDTTHGQNFRSRLSYGEEAGQLGSMKEGDREVVITSPPYADQNITGRRNFLGGGGNEQPAAAAGRSRQDGYGEHPGQLGAMKEGDLAITSPPYEGCDTRPSTMSKGAASRADGSSGGRAKGDYEYGDSEGQLGRMPAGAISSPPYPQPHTGGGGINIKGYQNEELRPGSQNKPFDLVGQRTYQGRGADREDGNLEILETGDIDTVITSPPFENVEGSNAGRKFKDPAAVARSRAERYQDGSLKGKPASEKAILAQLERENDRTYGDDPNNLGNMKGGFDQALTSPPYEHDSEPHGDLRPDLNRQEPVFVERDYGATAGNVSASPETFWSASRTILEQLYMVLAPGAHAIFVVKRFCRDGKIVDFPSQWSMLAEAVGFQLLHDHHALLTEEYGKQGGFEEDQVLQTSRRSFFRRIYEKNHPENAIDWENVLCFLRP